MATSSQNLCISSLCKRLVGLSGGGQGGATRGTCKTGINLIGSACHLSEPMVPLHVPHDHVHSMRLLTGELFWHGFGQLCRFAPRETDLTVGKKEHFQLDRCSSSMQGFFACPGCD